MTLHDLLLSDPANATRTDAEALVWLHETVTAPDPTPRDTNALMARLSPSEANAVFETLEAAAVDHPLRFLIREALGSLRGKGLDVSHQNARAMIDALFAGDAALRDKIKALGERQVVRWQLGFHREPELRDVTGART